MVSRYIGRFAPSPTGPLHYGSLFAALASYLDAKAHSGQWHLRIDDIDSTRIVTGADAAIMASLSLHGLDWDGPVSYQSQHYAQYHKALEQLQRQQHSYHCDCPRKRTAAIHYDRHCLPRQDQIKSPYATRFLCQSNHTSFDDLWQGSQHCDEIEDAVIWRKDGLCAYQLAVVIDDNALGVNHIIRGSDLLEPTHTQIAIYDALDLVIPHYGHFPVLIENDGRKLSKQNHATAIDLTTPEKNLRRVLKALGQTSPPASASSAKDILAFAIQHWRRDLVPRQNILWSNIYDTA